MFKYLSLFRRNTDEQLNDNDIDFNEVPAPADVSGMPGSETPVLIDNALGGQQEHPAKPKPAIDTTLQEQAVQARIDQVTKALHDIADGSSEIQTDTPLVPDLSLIHGYGNPEEDRPKESVGVTRFQKGDKILDFVTVFHVGNLQDSTHKTVAAAIATGNPQMVITEGHPTNMSAERRNGIIEWTKGKVEEVQSNDNIQDPNIYIPEAGYAAFVAREHGIDSVGGEPTGKELFDGMKARVTKMEPEGYSPEAVIADVFMRQIETIPPPERLSMTEEEFMTNHAERFMKIVNERIDPQHTANHRPLTLDQFKEWYAAHPLSRNRSFLEVSHDDFIPKQDGEYLQVMACESGVVRDENIAKLFAKSLETNDRVMVVYGADHLNSLRPLLENMFDTQGSFTKIADEDAPAQAA